MRRVVYLCPEDASPVGGIKVIHRHVAALNRLGVPAFVLHPHAPGFRCRWFQHDAPFLDDPTLNSVSDFVVIPDIFALSFGPRCKTLRCRYAIFVQNGYLLYPATDADAASLHGVMRGADLILSISADTDRMIRCNFPGLDPARLARVTFSVPDRFMSGQLPAGPLPIGQHPAGRGAAPKLVSFMPRKLPDHARRVAYALRQYLPAGWHIQAIDKVDEATCAAMLAASRLFLSFSDLEGLPLPPLEAALAGNLVVGYTGQGGAEYWDAPNFQAIAQGDIVGFVQAAQAAAAQIEAGLIGRDVLWPGITRLAQRFSAEAEARSLRAVADRIAAGRDAAAGGS